MKKICFVFAALIAIGLTACSKKASPGKIETVKKTSYSSEVIPLIQARCSPCHLPSKNGFKANFENYASAAKYGTEMVKRVVLNPGDKGFMPFKGQKLSAEEIAVFKKWVDDGMKE